MKILVVSHNSFSKIYNNGKTLSAIFSAFEKKDLCQLYFTPLGDPDEDRCGEYFLISDKNALRSILLRWTCGGVPMKTTQSTMSATSRKAVKQTSLKLALRSLMWNLSSWYYGGLKKWLSDQNPDLIFYVGGNSIFSHKISVSLSQKLNIPLLTYFTDDYVLNPPNDYYLFWLKRQYSKTIKKSQRLYAIGKQMASDYTEYYGREFIPIMNIVDIQDRHPYKESDSNQIVIGYFGGLHLGRIDEICRFANFLETNLPPDLKKKLAIKVYSFDSISPEFKILFDRYSITKEEGLTGESLKQAMERVDVFLHIESIKPEYHNITKLSVSTKIPEYMSFAKPIIAFGPADVASFRVIAEVNPELVFDDNPNVINNISHIAEMADNTDLIAMYGLKNYNYAKNNFSKTEVARLFKQSIEEIINKKV